MRLLAIFAHPDDEVFACGGTLAKAAAAGHDVHLICATRGEEGEIVDPAIDATAHPKGAARGKLREQELIEACRALGIQAPRFLDHADSGFPIEVGLQNPAAFMNQDLAVVERQLLDAMRELEPQVVVTFDPHGMYGHIDHIVAHRAANRAFWSAGGVMQPAPQRMYYPVRTIEQVRRAIASRPGSTTAKLVPEIEGVSEDSVAAVIDVRGQAEQKRLAVIAHSSQFGPVNVVDALIEGNPGMLEQELFVLGGLRGSFPTPPLDDLFSGL